VVHEPDNNISSCEVCGVCEDCEHLAECTKGTNNL
jgi:hypothetical protein